MNSSVSSVHVLLNHSFALVSTPGYCRPTHFATFEHDNLSMRVLAAKVSGTDLLENDTECVF